MYKCVILILSADPQQECVERTNCLKTSTEFHNFICRKGFEENGDTYVTLPSEGHSRETELASISVKKIYLNDKNTGMGSSISEGVKYMQ